jgi:phosphoglycolate phosphatase-like HAD superfamily hydrolase
MRIVLDVDGVLADFVSSALRVINEMAQREALPGYDVSPYTPDDVRQWEIESLLPKRFHTELFDRLSAPGFCASIEPYPSALAVVDALRATGHDVAIATSPLKGSTTWIAERTAWLQRYWGEIEIHHTHDKRGVRGDIFVDDKPSHVLDWQNANPMSRAFLLDRPYNRSAIGLTRLSYFRDLLRVVVR